MENDNTSQKMVRIEDLYRQKTVEHNDLITSVAKMDKIPLKFFELAVSCLDTNNPPADNTIYLSKKMLFSFFNATDGDKNKRFQNVLTNLHQQSVFEIRDEDQNGKWHFKIISPIASSEWNAYDDTVAIKFTDEIMPYLIDLKLNFTQYLITDIIELNSKYSIILYKWLSMHFNQYETYKDSVNRTRIQIDRMKNPFIELQELRRMTSTLNDYKRMYDFEKYVLKTSVEEINEHTHFDITYNKVKEGRSVTGIQFHIEKKKTKSSLPYKENDPEYHKNKAQREKKRLDLFNKAVQSKYTTLLGENLLIGFKDMQDVSMMADLQKQVYPLYDELQNLRGLNGVKDHISYVAEHKDGASTQLRNIVKYLKRSIEQYLPIVKAQNLEE